MKRNFILIIAFGLFFSCKTSGQQTANKDKQKGDQNNLKKEFKYHFYLLDSASKANPLDSIYTAPSYSVKFMEENTGINSRSDMTLLGKLFFSKNDLQKWHEWYEKKYGAKSN